MKQPVIEIEGLSKVYSISHQQKAPYQTFRDVLVGVAKKPAELITGRKPEREKFWALRDVSLSIDQGDVVGIIGRNGSGKSTLLKILSRIVEPTEGQAVLRGKVASLLEVGTGFHPELTGRENIYFNGAILGMSRREIRAKFDAIVEFSEIEKFLDTPVKFYSSGMYVRLAFAVAAHLEPDVLIVDEVLAVGDAEFQKKCLGKMQSVTKEGRTVLFVSHNMAAIQSICNRGILLQNGELIYHGDIEQTIEKYITHSVTKGGHFKRTESVISPKFRITEARLTDVSGNITDSYQAADIIELSFSFELAVALKNVQLVVEIWNNDGQCLLTSTNYDLDNEAQSRQYGAGTHTVRWRLENDFLREGEYFVSLSSSIPGHEVLDDLENILALKIVTELDDITKLNPNRRGLIYKRADWSVDRAIIRA